MDDFAAAVLASPADDAPRLVWADWLDERGHEESAALLRASAGRRPESRLYTVSDYAVRRYAWPPADLSLPGLTYETEADAFAALAEALVRRVFQLTLAPMTRPAP